MKELILNITRQTKEQGADFSEIKLSWFKSTEINFHQGKKHFSQENFRLETNLKVWKNGKVGRSFTTSSSNLAIEKLVENAFEAAKTEKKNSSTQIKWNKHNAPNEKDDSDTFDILESTFIMKDKLDLLKKINLSIEKKSSSIETSIHYFDKNGMFYFGNSDGYIVKNRISEYAINIINQIQYAKKNIKRSYYLCGRLDRNEQAISSCTAYASLKAQRLLDSVLITPAPKKKMNVVFDGEITGKLIHELCHGLDGDFVATTSPWKKKMNKVIFSKLLTIQDVPNLPKIPNLPSILYDCDGFKAEKTIIIENGKLMNFITDFQTANLLQCPNTHKSRISSGDLPSFPSSSNLVVSKGENSSQDLISEADYGLYCQGASTITIEWKEEMLTIMPEKTTMISKSELVNEPQIKVEIIFPIDDFIRALKMIGKNLIVSTILCTKGGGIVCGAISPPMMFERLTVRK